MKIDIILVSTKRTILIKVIWIISIQYLFFYSIIERDLKLYYSLILFGIGAIMLYFLLKYFARFKECVEINKDYFRLGENEPIPWDSIKSYEYSDTGLFVGLILRTTDKTIRIIGLTKGPEREKFNQIRNYFFEILKERVLSSTTPKIAQYNTYNNKVFRILSYIFICISLALILYVSFLLITGHKFRDSNIYLKLFILVVVSLSMIIRLKLNTSDSNKNASG